MSGEERPLVIPGPEAGSEEVIGGTGEVTLGGKRFVALWGLEEPEGCQVTLEIPLSSINFPLMVKGWEPGDRIQLPFGTKKLKKLFGEARIPVEERGRTPILQDGVGRILWVAGLASSVFIVDDGHEDHSKSWTFFLGIRHAGAE